MIQLPKTIKRNPNDLTLCWQEVFESNSDYCNYRLEIRDDAKEWKCIYCGPKTVYKVDRLAPCTCYDFRLKQTSTDWVNFKAATQDLGPYTSVIHMTRAVKMGKTSVIRKIAQLRPSLLNAENKEHKTPIFQAIEAKDLQVLQLLITLGANVNKPLLHCERTALMFAIYKGELQAASLLLDKGAKISNRDINGLTIIHHAVDSNNLANLKFALDTRLDINLQDNNGWTALLRAVILQCKQELVDCLIVAGADIYIKDNNGFDYVKHQEISSLYNKRRGEYNRKIIIK